MTTVYFIRHAEPNYQNHDDASRELSPKGMQDRKLVTRFLLDKHVDVILSSPFKRAVDTVADFAETCNMEILRIDDFRERKVDNGWIHNFTDFTKRQWGDLHYKLSDGESLSEVQNRCIDALNAVLAQYPDKTIAIGSHGTALSTVIQYYNPSFDYADFCRIKDLMPWVVGFTFEGGHCVSITEYDLLGK